MNDKPLDLCTTNQIRNAMANMPDAPNEITHYFAAGTIEAEWAKRNFPGLTVVEKPIIPGQTLFGIPVHLDPSMPPNTFRLVPKPR